MTSSQVESEDSFQRLVRQTFPSAAADVVLKAHDCASARLGVHTDQLSRPADILLRHQADHIAVTAGLLAPLRRSGYTDFNEIRSLFGEQLALLVERVFSEDTLRTDPDIRRSEMLLRFLESISTEIRAAPLRIALRLAELEKPVLNDDRNRQDVARETLELYVPLSDRLGMSILRAQLEDASFAILNPSDHELLAQCAASSRHEDEVVLDLLLNDITHLLAQNGVRATVHGRIKGLYGLYRKMCQQGCSASKVTDRIGLRIIVSSVKECYQVLSLLHARFRPVPGMFDDYIRFPKENGYQSLHTCVYPVPDISRKLVEFQIRTVEMHHEAQFGTAAHWLYKDRAEAEHCSARQLQWLRSLLIECERCASDAEFIKYLHRQVSDDLRMVIDRAPVQFPRSHHRDDIE